MYMYCVPTVFTIVQLISIGDLLAFTFSGTRTVKLTKEEMPSTGLQCLSIIIEIPNTSLGYKSIKIKRITLCCSMFLPCSGESFCLSEVFYILAKIDLGEKELKS